MAPCSAAQGCGSGGDGGRTIITKRAGILGAGSFCLNDRGPRFLERARIISAKIRVMLRVEWFEQEALAATME
jgi:hypothetical protein